MTFPPRRRPFTALRRTSVALASLAFAVATTTIGPFTDASGLLGEGEASTAPAVTNAASASEVEAEAEAAQVIAESITSDDNEGIYLYDLEDKAAVDDIYDESDKTTTMKQTRRIREALYAATAVTEEHPSPRGRSRRAALHHACFRRSTKPDDAASPPGDRGIAIDDEEEARHTCCFDLATSGHPLITAVRGGQGEAYRWCRDKIVPVPSVSDWFLGDGLKKESTSGELRPVFYLVAEGSNPGTKVEKDDGEGGGYRKQVVRKSFLEVDVEEERDRAGAPSATTPKAATSSAMTIDAPPVVHGDMSVHHRSNGEVRSPFHLPPTDADRIVANRPTWRRYFDASISSDLAPNKGHGLHRPFRHKITLTYLDHNVDEKNEREGIMVGKGKIALNGTIAVFLPLTEDTYVDADDPFLSVDDVDPEGDGRRNDYSESNDCTVTLLDKHGLVVSDDGPDAKELLQCTLLLRTTPGEVIDIEQPAFASRQHVLAIRIKLSTIATTVPCTVEVRFGTMLHVRYPAPLLSSKERRDRGLAAVAEEDDVPEGFRAVYVPRPVVYDAEFTALWNGGSAVDEIAPKGSLYFLRTFAFDEKEEDEEGLMHIVRGGWMDDVDDDVLTTYTPAGIDADHDVVTLVTVVVAIVGAYGMLSGLSGVSIWC